MSAIHELIDSKHGEKASEDLISFVGQLESIMSLMDPKGEVWALGDAITKLEEIAHSDLSDAKKLQGFLYFFRIAKIKAH